jgi:CheY-like chemotaxis protein
MSTPRSSQASVVLVVDDNLALAENIAEILGSVGHVTAVATSAEAALDRVRQGGVAAVVTDYRLPGVTGADLILALRREKFDIPVAVMSAYTDAGMIERAELSDAVDVMPKPIDIARLMRVVAAFGKEIDMLVVDDNAELAENLAEALRARGLRAVVGHSARDALTGGGRPRAALIDFRLPDRSGTALAQRLKARDPSIQICLFSAYLDDLRRAAARELPDVLCLSKPIDMDRLLVWAASTATEARRS